MLLSSSIYKDGTFIHSKQSNDEGEFTFMMPSYPPLSAGETLQLKADKLGKVMSNALVLTTVMQ
jgi:hypothetical protein